MTKWATFACSIFLAASFAVSATAHEQVVTLQSLGGSTGYAPTGGVITDRHGNVFGTTTIGGTGSCLAGAGCGTVYEVSPSNGGASWTFSVIHNFLGGQDGAAPQAQLTVGPNGSLFGYSADGTYGAVFQLLPPANGKGAWTLNMLHVFSNETDGNLEFVYSPLIWHHNTLYGIASGGSNACGQAGCGSVFKLAPPLPGKRNWREHTLFSFAGGNASGVPSSIVGFNGQDALYVSTTQGNGAVVELARSGGTWNETVLTEFKGGADGSSPGSLVLGPNHTIYGIAGTSAFQLANNGSGWTRTNIARVHHRAYGPNSLAVGPNGSLIGTIWGDVDFFPGAVFQLTPPANGGNWTYTELWNFNRGPDRNPVNAVTGLDGNLFGVLNGGDSGNGTVFELK